MVLRVGSSGGSAGSCCSGTTRAAAGWSLLSRGSGACGQQSRLPIGARRDRGRGLQRTRSVWNPLREIPCGTRAGRAPRPGEASEPRGAGGAGRGRAAGAVPGRRAGAMHGERALPPRRDKVRRAPGAFSAARPTEAATRGWPGSERGRLQGGMPGSGAAGAAAPARPVCGGYLAGWVALEQHVTFFFFLFLHTWGLSFETHYFPPTRRRLLAGFASARRAFGCLSGFIFLLQALTVVVLVGRFRCCCNSDRWSTRNDSSCCTVELNCVASALNYLLGLFAL